MENYFQGGGVGAMKIIEYIEINNTKQCVSIRTKNPKNPTLLYLHGGPGDAVMPLEKGVIAINKILMAGNNGY